MRTYCRTYLQKDIPVPVIIKGIRIQNLKFGDIAPSIHILLHKLLIRVRPLRILIKELHVRMRRCGVEIVIELLYVFAMVPLMASDSKETLFQDTIFLVPERER